MQTFEQIQYQVGPWSRANFGHQETPFLTCVPTDIPHGGQPEPMPLLVRLEGLAPLMGLMEELGELFEGGTTADVRDAVGDISIYLCDYCCREGIVIPYRIEWDKREHQLDPMSGMVAMLGRMYHAHLKRFQRIRGMDDYEKFAEARLAALRRFMFYLDAFAKEHCGDTNLITIVNETWNGIVAKRDWKADAAAGGGHRHDG